MKIILEMAVLTLLELMLLLEPCEGQVLPHTFPWKAASNYKCLFPGKYCFGNLVSETKYQQFTCLGPLSKQTNKVKQNTHTLFSA